MKPSILLVILLIAFPVFSADQMVTEILQKALKALGGKEKLEQMQTREWSGKVQVKGLSGTYQLWAKAPNKIKTSLDLSVVQQDRAFDGIEGWQKQVAVEQLQGPDLARLKRSALFFPLLSYVQNDTPASFKGKEKIGDQEMIVLEFLPQPDSPERFYFDPATFLLMRESRALPREKPEEVAGQMVIEYSDYRNVDGWMVPFTFTQTIPGQVLTVKIDQYRINTPMADSIFRNPVRQYANEPFGMNIRTIPLHVYRENDGVWEPAPTESFYFHLLVQEKYGRPIEPAEAKLELYAGKELLKTVVLSAPQLNAIRKVSFGGSAKQEELFDLVHSFSEPVSPAITGVIYTLHGSTASGQKLQKTLEIPVTTYEQKTKLIFPLKGRFVVAGGHDYNEAHKGEWSQHYAFDIVALGPNYDFARNGGKANEDFFTWGQDVLAPADGVVSFARNDIPDNKLPGVIDNTVFMGKPDPLNAIGGNNVVIDHGNGEFSLLAHFQQGSVRVKKGDRVKQGQIIGKLGNSGNSDGPHLHYHLMAGPQIFRNDGLPARFDNVFIEAFSQQDIKITSPKRGVYVIAK